MGGRRLVSRPVGTGELIGLTGETWSLLESIDEDGGVVDSSTLIDRLDGRGVPEWQRTMALDAARISDGEPGRWLVVPRTETHEAYEDMRAFIETVPSPAWRARLEDAIDGRGAFRRFRDLIDTRRSEERRWFAFSRARTRQRVLDWLASEGIEPA